ncbi:MAG: CDP-alcohol phosphatidyltransferase family protein [Chloroflexota bacterium]
MAEQLVNQKERLSFTDWMRRKFGNIFNPLAAFLNRIGLMPNTVTLIGLLGNTLGAYFLARGEMTIGGLIVLLMGPVDALDGAMARLRGHPTEFGAFVDSVTDRYSELVIFGGLLLYYIREEAWLPAILVYLAAAGSVLVSYVRARAQSVGIETKVGILTRFERYLVLAPGLVFNIPLISIWILAIFTHITAVQRIMDVRRQFRKPEKSA